MIRREMQKKIPLSHTLPVICIGVHCHRGQSCVPHLLACATTNGLISGSSSWRAFEPDLKTKSLCALLWMAWVYVQVSSRQCAMYLCSPFICVPHVFVCAIFLWVPCFCVCHIQVISIFGFGYVDTHACVHRQGTPCTVMVRQRVHHTPD